jgi:Response regulator containing CheY-like receiver domain and AraC-type DNA-binding domain
METLKVILVDDESIVISDMRTLINWEENGFSIEGWAYTADHAIDLVKRLHPDIAFVDVSLPSMDGIELAQRFKEIAPNITIAILSGYMDFSYAQRAIDVGTFTYLVKHQLTPDMLLSVLQKIRERIERQKTEAAMIRFKILADILDENISIEQFTQQERQFISCYEKAFILVMITPVTPFFKKEQIIIPPELPMLVMKAHCPGIHFSDVLAVHNHIAVFAQSEQKIIGAGAYASIVYGLMQSILDSVSETGQRFFAVCLSRPSVITALYENYRLLRRYLSQSIFYENTSVLVVDDVKESTSLTDELSFISRNHFLNTYADMREKVSEYLSKAIVAKDHVSFHTCIQRLINLAEEFEPHFLISNESSNLYVADQIKDYLLHQLDLLHQNYNSRQSYSAITNFVIQYINKNYNQQPSLREVSDLLHSNWMYVGQKFKKDTGKTFHDYLTGCRILHAKSLLSDTNLKIFEISEKIGIVNSQYLCKVFKDLTGLTPNEYRNQQNAH